MTDRRSAPGGPDSEPDTVELPVGDVLDLHSFPPREVSDLVQHYLDCAFDEGLSGVRIVHGKGMGVQRSIVRKLLERHPRVEAYGDAPLEAGGWGATWVRFHSRPDRTEEGRAGNFSAPNA